MSQRTIGGLDNLPSLKDLQENLLNFEYNLKNEFEILNACVKLVNSQTLQNVQDEIQILKVQISEEIDSYKEFNQQIQRRSYTLTAQDVEEYNILKLKYNKLILQVEKVYSSSPEMEAIINKFPRSKLRIESQTLIGQHRISNEDTMPKSNNALSRILPRPPLSSNSMISNNSSIIQTLNPQYGKGAAEIIKGIAKRETLDENNKEFIKRELIQLKQLIQDVNKKVDIHDHTEYDMELDRLRKENNQIMHDYKILKNDNTELMHSLRTLSKMAQEVKIQNERLLLGIQNPQALRHHYSPSPIMTINNPPSSSEQRGQEGQYQPSQYPPSRLSAVSQQNVNKEGGTLIQSPQILKAPTQTKRNTFDIIASQQKNNQNNNHNHNNNNNNNIQSPEYLEYQQKEQSNRVLTRNSSHLTNANKYIIEHNQKNSVQRSLIPSQQSNREEGVDYDLLSSWARKRLMEQ